MNRHHLIAPLLSLILTTAGLSDEPKWFDATRGQQLADLKATAQASITAPGELESPARAGMLVQITWYNKSRIKKYEFVGKLKGVIISDEYGNTYKRRLVRVATYSRTGEPYPVERIKRKPASLYPEDEFSLGFLCQYPIAAAREIRITFPGQHVGIKGDFRLTMTAPELPNGIKPSTPVDFSR